jgi:hypothetical protein
MVEHPEIRFTDHANQRCIERWVDQNDVRAIIRNPIGAFYDQTHDNVKCYGLATDTYTKEQKY